MYAYITFSKHVSTYTKPTVSEPAKELVQRGAVRVTPSTSAVNQVGSKSIKDEGLTINHGNFIIDNGDLINIKKRDLTNEDWGLKSSRMGVYPSFLFLELGLSGNGVYLQLMAILVAKMIVTPFFV